MQYPVEKVVDITIYVPVTFKATITDFKKECKFQYEDDHDVTHAYFPDNYTVVPKDKEITIRLNESYKNISVEQIKDVSS
jgi:hypothetical protein